uniref:ACYPI006387 protein n=1 Tax=Acyrthosiphon pisum TaxID=7029 RepID=C4WT48_ACYPI|nr:ACYPI006387 [Acyrthosiphon pisum]
MPRSKVVHGMIAMDDVSDNNKIWRMLFAEFLGTAILLFLGCGSIMWLNGSTNSSDILAISLTFGFTIATLVQIFGQTSGCHINPAVTVSFLVSGQCSFFEICSVHSCTVFGGYSRYLPSRICYSRRSN